MKKKWMDQMASDITGVTLDRNQSILLNLILAVILSSGCLQVQFPSMPMHSTEYITVLSCS